METALVVVEIIAAVGHVIAVVDLIIYAVKAVHARNAIYRVPGSG